MVFSSLEFLFFFLPVFLIGYYLFPVRFRTLFLLLGGLGFYWYGTRGNPFYLLLFLLSALTSWVLGLLLWLGRGKRFLLTLGVCAELGILIFYKYAGFLVGIFSAAAAEPLRSLVLPLGVSFTTFMHLSYLIDVYRGDLKPESSFLRYAAFSSFFPKLTSGPITRYGSMAAGLRRPTVSMAALDDGLRDFLAGLGCKVLLANRIGGLWNELSMIGYDCISTPLAWMGAVAFSLQLYFDFYGYSRMAVGLGRMLGFRLPDNFHYPYLARSMTEFWRRWHITLGDWFRRYLYIPLGGNRCSRLTHTRNLFVVWLCTGLWHGASWNFVLWGLLLFLSIYLEKNFTLPLLTKNSLPAKLLSHCYMLFLIPVQWIFFAIPDLSQLLSYLGRLFGLGGPAADPTDYLRYFSSFGPRLAVGLLFATPLPRRLFRRFRTSIFGTLLYFLLFVLSVFFLAIGSNDPFLYFNF